MIRILTRRRSQQQIFQLLAPFLLDLGPRCACSAQFTPWALFQAGDGLIASLFAGIVRGKSGAVLSEDRPWDNDTVSYTYENGRRRNTLSLLQPNAGTCLLLNQFPQ